MQHFWKSQPGSLRKYMYFPPPRVNIFSCYSNLTCTLSTKLWILESFWCWRVCPYMQFHCRRGATVHFSCDEGYELQGSKSISCLRVTDSYVGWSDDRPICRGKHRPMSCHLCTCIMNLVPVCPPFIFSWSGAPVLMCLRVTVLSFVGMPSPFSCLLIQYSPFYCDWPDFDLWPAFL